MISKTALISGKTFFQQKTTELHTLHALAKDTWLPVYTIECLNIKGDDTYKIFLVKKKLHDSVCEKLLFLPQCTIGCQTTHFKSIILKPIEM